MKIEVERQLGLEDTNEEYKAFVDKFKPKKTTDDCYTPENVYNAIADWVAKEYSLEKSTFVRPFWPGGDYERFDYQHDSVVVDNPPFSIISRICEFYEKNGIKYFLFAPYLTNFSTRTASCHIITDATILYENGAEVNTSFLTNLDKYVVRGTPDLYQIIKKVNDENMKAQRKSLPKYVYPFEVLTSTDVGKFSKYGVPYALSGKDAVFIRAMDAQRKVGKAIFGGVIY